jgi:hypothetical protein
VEVTVMERYLPIEIKRGFFRTERVNMVIDDAMIKLGDEAYPYEDVKRIMISGIKSLDFDIQLQSHFLFGRIDSKDLSSEVLSDLKVHLGERLTIDLD